MSRFLRDLFSVYFLGLELPYVVLFFSIFFLLPFQIYLSMKKNRFIQLLPAILHSLATLYYLFLHLIGRHWDGTSYLVFVFLNAYLIFMCVVGIWCGAMIKKYGMLPIRRLIVAAVLEIVFMIVLPWWGNMYAPREGAVPLIFYCFVTTPAIFCISGFLAGNNVEQFWVYPIMAIGMYLIGNWESKLRSIAETLPGYFVISLVMILAGVLMKRIMYGKKTG